MIASLDPMDVDRFRDLVAARLGLQFEKGKGDRLEAVLQERLQRTRSASFAAYLNRLMSGEYAKSEWTAIAAELTVVETYFFRHIEQFRAFTSIVLNRRTQAQHVLRRLRVLSAGCASGEEAYSLAILLRDHLADADEWDLRVVGIDLNTSVLERAAQARYTAWSLRGVSEDVRRRCFRRLGDEFVLDDAVRELASFSEANLAAAEPATWQNEEYDAIFCRNVTMYLTPGATRIVVERLTEALSPGGFLFLGPAESLRGISQDYHLCHSHDTFYYRRKSPDRQPTRHAIENESECHELEPMFHCANAFDESWSSAIGQASERIAKLSLAVNGSLSPGDTARRPPCDSPVASALPILAAAHEMTAQERFNDALQVLQTLPDGGDIDSDARLLQAALLTNCGRIAEAEQLCRLVLDGDELNAEAHYLLALCREHAGRYQAATEENQKAIHLDSQFAMPHVHLGLLAKRAGDQEAAARAFGRADALFPLEDAARILLFGGGFSRGALVQLCQAQLRACGGDA